MGGDGRRAASVQLRQALASRVSLPAALSLTLCAFLLGRLTLTRLPVRAAHPLTLQLRLTLTSRPAPRPTLPTSLPSPTPATRAR